MLDIFLSLLTIQAIGSDMKIKVQGVEVSVSTISAEDYFSLTDIARYRDAERSDYILQNWMRNRSTIEFMGLWESFHNPNFNPIEFDGFRTEAGANSFSLTPKRWIDATNAIGVISKPGRYGGTFAHKDIAFEFATWISAEFKFYLITEFQRLQKKVAEKENAQWTVGRLLSKVNYRLHTDSIQAHLIPPEITQQQAQAIYASEADLLNVALFGTTASQWRAQHPAHLGNIREQATITQLVVLANLESLNAIFIQQGMPPNQRLQVLNAQAVWQMKTLLGTPAIKNLEELGKQHRLNP